MRRLTLFLMSVMAALSVVAQAQRMAPANYATPQSALPQDMELTAQAPSLPVVSPWPVGATTAATITATKIGEGANAFGSLATDVNQVSHISSANFMVAVYRNNSAVCGGQSGHYRYSYSTDLGATWDVAAGAPGACYGYGFMNPNFSQACRYPNIVAHMPSGQTSVDSIDLVYAGWHHDGVNGNPFTRWTGSITGTVNNATSFTSAAVSVTQEDYPMVPTDDEGSATMVERVDGEYWIPSFIVSANPAVDGDMNLWKGEYNNATGVVDWAVAATLDPNHVDPATIRSASTGMAFGPSGLDGIVAWCGDVVAPAGSPVGSDSTLSIVYSLTADGGTTWGPVEEVPMASFTKLRDSLENFWITVLTNGDTVPASAGIPTTGFDLDVTMDANGSPHVIVQVGSGAITNDDGTTSALGVYSIYSGLRKFIYDFTLDVNGDWNGIYLGSNATFRGEFTGISADPYVQASRSDDGTKLFFSWTDSDTTGLFGVDDNLNPDLFGRAYDVTTGLISDIVNFTDGDVNWDGLALFPTVDPVALFDGTCTYTIPTMVSEFTDGASTTGYWYWSNIQYDACTDITLTPNFLTDCSGTTLANTSNVNQPDCGSTDGSIDVTATGGVTPYTYLWNTGATTPNLTGIGAGTYSVVITDALGCTVDETFVVESANAPTATETVIADISCAGLIDGSGAMAMAGGQAPFSFAWGNGETDSVATQLPAGTTPVTITDASGCITFAEITITEPDALVVFEVVDGQETCVGDANGEVTANAIGGTGTLDYAWDNGGTGGTISGLAPGTYNVTVTDDNGCESTASATVSAAPELAPTLDSIPAFTLNGGSIVVSVTGAPGNGPDYTYEAVLIDVNGNPPAPFDTTITSSDPNGEPINGLCGGTYQVTTTDASGCTSIDTITVQASANFFCAFTTSIDEIGTVSTFNVFPNPTTGAVQVELELNSTDDLRLEVINTQGQVVMARSATNVPNYSANFDLSGQAGGVYLIRVTTSAGSQSAKVLLR